MNRGARRAPIFHTDEHCAAFLGLLEQLPERFGLAVHGYALMPNHYHLMVQSRRGELSRGMAFLQARYSLFVNRERRWDGPLFRARFRSKWVTRPEHWRHLLAYLHLNPVRARLVMTPSQSRWTSHEAYAGRTRRPNWLTTGELLAAFGGRKRYAAYLQSCRRKSSPEPEDFDREVLFGGGRGSATSSDAKEPELDQPLVTPSVAESVALASQRLHVARRALVEPRPGRAADPRRSVLVWWLVQRQGIRVKDVAAALDISPGRVSQLVARVQDRRMGPARDPSIDALCRTVAKAKR